MNETVFSKEYKPKIYIIFGLVLIFWAIEVINIFTGNSLISYGIVPGELSGLFGIFFAPFLHVDIKHLLANTLPFLVTGGFTILRGISLFFKISLYIIITSGIFVWIYGHPGIHLGVSALIFGYLGYLIANAFIERSSKTIIIATIMSIFFGTMIFGIFPGAAGISWEGHLSGFLAGITASWLFKSIEK